MGASCVFAGGQSIDIGSNNPISGASAFSFALWLKTTDITAKQYWLGRSYDSSITVGFDGTSTFVHFEVQCTGTGGHFIRQTDDQISGYMSNNTWVHLAFSYDYNSGTPIIGMYADGVSKANSNRSWADAVSAVGAGSGNFGVGDTPLAGTFDFSGNIAYVSMFDKAISSAEVLELMANPESITQNRVAYWDCLTTSPPDLSGNGFDGTNNSAAESADGPPIFLSRRAR